MRILYGSLNKIGKIFAIPLSFLVSNKLFYRFFTIVKIYLSILLGQGSGTGWGLSSEAIAAAKIIRRKNQPSEQLTIFDIGANKGEWSNMISKRINNASFYLFEPQLGCHRYILEKEIPNLKIFPLAVSSSVGERINLFSTSESAGLASVYKRRDTYFQNEAYYKIEAKTTSIDAIITDNEIKWVDFIKLDIEGHELEALKGGLSSLNCGTIHALAFEFGSGNINSRTYFHDFWDLLFPLGYHFYRILPWGGLLPVLDYTEDLEYLRGATNYIAVKE